MAFINVAEWTPGNVADWLRGLDDSVLPYVQFFVNNNVNGCRLLLLTYDDLESLNVHKIGHQEIFLEGVSLLKHLHYDFASETLQSQALRLGCRARSLYNQLKADECENQTNQDRVSTSTLSSVTDILVSVKSFISWIDRYPFSAQDSYFPVREGVLRRSIELASTAQRDQFVEHPNKILKDSCASLADLCDRIVTELNDSLAITPASLEVVGIKKRVDEELGLQIYSSYCGVHQVGGILNPSASSRCLRIEEGDEIVQIKYQTVVGWQMKNMVNLMKEYPTEILLTLKKRPRHSPYIGQAVVTKAHKLRRPHSRTQVNRFKVANEASADSEEENFEVSYQQTQLKGPAYQVPPRKPKTPVRRRATISGSSPTSLQPPFRVEDLVPKPRKDHLGRSISHDSSNESEIHRQPVPTKSQQLPSISARNSTSSTNSSSHVPHARVHPLPAPTCRPPIAVPNETVPKQVIGSNRIYDQVPFEFNEEVSKPKSGPNIGVVIPNHSKTGRDCKFIEVLKINDTPPPLPARSSSTVRKLKAKASREVSCKSLGIVDYQGWLHLRRESRNAVPSKVRWLNRWVVLKQNFLYSFKNPDSSRADCLISLPGFVVAPASEGRKYSFRVYNLTTDTFCHVDGKKVRSCGTGKTFFFSSESVADMSKWISKIGFAAISYSSTSDSVDEAFFSESDNSDEEATYMNEEEYQPRKPPLPARNILRNNSTASLASNASSIGVPMAPPPREVERKYPKPVPSPVVRSNSNIDSSSLPKPRRAPVAREFHNEHQENYVELAIPPPSPRCRKQTPPSPGTPPKYVELAQLDDQGKPPLPVKPGSLESMKRRSKEPPTPIPRVSKLKERLDKEEGKTGNTPTIVGAQPKNLDEKKRVDQLLDSPDQLLNPVYNHVIPKDQGNRLAVAVDPDIFSKTSSPEAGQMSILDREYNRLFGDKSPLELNKCVPARKSTDVVANIYGITSLERSGPTSSSTLPRRIELSQQTRNNRSHSPISDNSCSSSSGISSTQSTYLGSSQNRIGTPMKAGDVDDVFASQELDQENKSKKPVKSNSFRLLNSPKLLKKFSTPKYHKGRRQEKNSVKSPDDTKSSISFFGWKKHSPDDPSTRRGLRRSASINKSHSDSSLKPSVPGRSHSAERLKLPPIKATDPTDGINISPESLKKPTMGIAMIKKKRASTVSSDTSAIETALGQQSDKSGAQSLNSSLRSCNSPDTDEEWSNIVRSFERIGLPVDGPLKTSQLNDEEVCHIVLSLRSYQKNLKDERVKEKDAIDELLKKPITLEELHTWLSLHPNLLP